MFTKPSWKLRRRATFGTLVFALAIIAYVALKWDSTSLAETLVLSMAGLAGGVVTAYIGFATVEDRAVIAQIGNEDHDLYDEVLESRQRARHQNVGAKPRSDHGSWDTEHSDG